MRMAIVENIGHLIKYLTTSEDEKRDKKINSLFELLIERFLDLNSYVRAKVFNVIIRLCEYVGLSRVITPLIDHPNSLPHKFPKRRLEITEHTVGALLDKSSSVRRYAIALLTKLILTHPYGIIHGGELNIHEWQRRYDEVAAELASLEQRPVDEAGPVEEEDEEGDEEEDESAILGVTVDEDGEVDASTVGGMAPSAMTKTSKGSKRSKKTK
jgi:condensin complex subunit 1